MKVLFLDLDGVLVTRRIGCMEERLVLNLKRIVEETGTLIVLSSDWRRWREGRVECRRVLRSHGMDFIGCTPCMSAMHGNRPIEILRWMRAHNKKATEEEGGEEKVSEWVAVDDRMLLGEKQGIKLEGHFVHTHPRQGLTQAAANQCIAILNGEGPQVAKAATSRKPALSASGWLPSARRAEVRSERAERREVH